MRQQKAEIIIRRKSIGSASNDIGFKQQEDGTFSAIISDFDSSTYDKDWLNQLCQTYAQETVREVANEQGFSFEEEVIDGQIHIHCERAF